MDEHLAVIAFISGDLAIDKTDFVLVRVRYVSMGLIGVESINSGKEYTVSPSNLIHASQLDAYIARLNEKAAGIRNLLSALQVKE